MRVVVTTNQLSDCVLDLLRKLWISHVRPVFSVSAALRILPCQCRTDSSNKKKATRDHAHAIEMILLLFYLYPLLVLSVSAHQSRSYNPLSTSQLKRLIQLDPPQFSSVTDGHLGKLLIPRPCMCLVTFLDL